MQKFLILFALAIALFYTLSQFGYIKPVTADQDSHFTDSTIAPVLDVLVQSEYIKTKLEVSDLEQNFYSGNFQPVADDIQALMDYDKMKLNAYERYIIRRQLQLRKEKNK